MKSTLFLALAVSAWIGSYMWQQPDTRPRTRTTTGDKTQPSQRPSDRGDDLFASGLLLGGKNEITLAEIAQRKAQDPEVKRFAEMMIKDHQEMAGKLQPFASQGGATYGNFQMVALVEELGGQCLESSRNLLEQKQGADFDRCYMGMALTAHHATKDMMTVFQRHASPELASLVADGLRTVSTHLEHAERIVQQLGDDGITACANTTGEDRGPDRINEN